VGVNEEMHASDLLRQRPPQLFGSKLLLQVKRNLWALGATVLSSGEQSTTSYSIAKYHSGSIGQGHTFKV
jgi:hypothetical protein